MWPAAGRATGAANRPRPLQCRWGIRTLHLQPLPVPHCAALFVPFPTHWPMAGNVGADQRSEARPTGRRLKGARSIEPEAMFEDLKLC